MKRRNIIIAISAAAISAALITSPAIACNKGECNGYRNHSVGPQGPGGMGKHQGYGMQGKHFDHDKGMFGAIQQLDLNDKQRTQISAILETGRLTRQDRRKPHWQERGKLHELVTAENWNKAAIEAYAEERAQSVKEEILARAETKRQIYELLTPEQRTQLENIHESRQAMHSFKGR